MKINHITLAAMLLAAAFVTIAKPMKEDPLTKILCELYRIDYIIMSSIPESNPQQYPLHDAVITGKIEEVEKVLAQKDIDINGMNQNSDFALLLAIRLGHSDIARLLIAEGANINLQEPDYLYTPLYESIEQNNIDITLLLIKTGAHLHLKNTVEETPLHFSSRYNLLKVARTLVETGADITTLNYRNETALDIALANGWSKEIAAYLTNVQNYYQKGTIVARTKENQLVVPNYFSLGLQKNCFCTIYRHLPEHKELSHWIKSIQFKPETKLDTLCAIIAIHQRYKQEHHETIDENDYKNILLGTKPLLELKKTEKALNTPQFTDVLLLTYK